MSELTDASRGSQSRLLLSPRTGLILGGAMLLVALPFIVRVVRLSSVPDPGDPFDIAAFTAISIPAEENAFEPFRKAAALFRPLAGGPSCAEGLEKALDEGWDSAPDSVRQWVADNAPSREQFELGAARPDSLYLPIAALSWDTPLPVMQHIRGLQRAQVLEAARLRSEGNSEAAWDRLYAAYRASRLCGKRGCVIERLVGSALHALAAEHLARWAADPQTSVDQLRRALAAVRADNRLTAPLSVGLKCDYLMVRGAPLSAVRASAPLGFWGSWISELELWVIGEPQLTRRVASHYYGNLLSQCDLPGTRQRLATGGTLGLFDTTAPGAPPTAPGVASPAEIETMSSLSPMVRLILPAGLRVQTAIRREQARQAVLELLLEVEALKRKTGRLPSTTADLERQLGHPLPPDPCSATDPLRYRCDDPDGLHAILWSNGSDLTDNGGLVDESSTRSGADVIGYAGGRPPPPEPPESE